MACQFFSYFFINFAQVTTGVGVFLRSYYQAALSETLFFSSINSFFLLFPFFLRTNVRWLEFR